MADKARALLERLRWPDGVVCPHCGAAAAAFRLRPTRGACAHVRAGVWKCGACRKQFTVTVGTIFGHSRLPLRKWLQAIRLACRAMNGVTTRQLQESLGVAYKTAWLVTKRLRYVPMVRTGPLTFHALGFEAAVCELLKVKAAGRRDRLELLDAMVRRADRAHRRA